MKSTYKRLSTKPKKAKTSALLKGIASISAVALIATALNASAVAMPHNDFGTSSASSSSKRQPSQMQKEKIASTFESATLPEELKDLGIEPDRKSVV